MKIGFVVNNLDTELPTYTTTHLAMVATNRGHEVWYVNVSDFAYDPDENVHAWARRVPPRRYRSTRAYLKAAQGKDAPSTRITIDELDILFLRNDPAEDAITRPWARLAGINFGRLAKRHGVLVFNDPDGLAGAVNKLYLHMFPEEVRPKTLITRSQQDVKRFADEQGTIVLKPLYGSGGRNVFLCRPEDRPNMNQMLEAVLRDGYVIAQEYLPGASQGDTRLFLLNGIPLKVKGHYGAIHRVRRGEDIRSNITAGASASKAEISEPMLRITELIKPKLNQDGMYFVGLDIVDEKLMEINVFSPGGLEEAECFEGVQFNQAIVRDLEEKVTATSLS